MRPILPLAVLAVGSLLALPRGAREGAVDAGTAIRLTVPELVECADLVLEGRVLPREVEQPSPRRIETRLTLAVDRTFWGEDRAERVVRLPGGVLEDESGLVIPGMPAFAVGEEVLLFLSEEGSTGVRVPVGLSQGKLRVETALDGRRWLSRSQGDLSVLDPRTGHVRCAGAGERLDYAGTIAEVWAAVDSRRQGEGR